ncbi:MAG: diguanylate cyclase [Planctomycetota bacterium]|nr:diguanylate cyclase [Planctomycetota bacterium]
MSDSLHELRLTGALPSPSVAGVRILELTRSGGEDARALESIVLADPALSGQLIKAANDLELEGLGLVTTVQQAASLLGPAAVRDVALGFTLPGEGLTGTARAFDYDRYWAVALASAVSAHVLAQALRHRDPAEAFTCALVCDIGRLAFATLHPGRYSELLEENIGVDERDLGPLESRIFGIDHCELSASILASWGLPREFQEVALLRVEKMTGLAKMIDGGTGDEDSTGSPRSLLSLVRAGRDVAQVLAGSWDLDDREWCAAFTNLVQTAEVLGLSHDALISLCDAIGPSWAEWAAVIGRETRQVKCFRSAADEVGRRGLRAPGRTSIGAEGPAMTEEERDAALFEVEADLPLEREGAGSVADEGPTRVLLVDDDPRMLGLIGHHLRREGYEVLTAGSSSDGLAAALEHHPQIVITDWMMPGMSGIELCRSLRRSKTGAKMYVLIVTARGEDEQIVEAFDAGADDYVVKPFNPRILLARVRAGARTIQLRERIEHSERSRLRQVAELGIMTRRLREAALTDPLTDLPNRRYAMKRLKQEWETARRTGRPLSVIMCDIDHFKRVNDEHGHDTGDVVLREVAGVLRTSGRTSDVLCRVGGEEFIVIHAATDIGTTERAAERLREAVARLSIDHGTYQSGVTLSLGVAQRLPGMAGIDELIKAADEALYAAKASGRNRTCVAGRPDGGSLDAGGDGRSIA